MSLEPEITLKSAFKKRSFSSVSVITSTFLKDLLSSFIAKEVNEPTLSFTKT